jgi:SAM-dependent methyltransferase
MDDKELRRYLNVIKRAVSLIEGMLDNDDDGLMEQLAAIQSIPDGCVHSPTVRIEAQPEAQPEEELEIPEVIPEPEPEPEVSQPIQRTPARKAHVQQLLEIDCWPEAVAPFLAEKVPTDEDQIKRANSVLDTMLTSPIEGKSFLDFGCGEGWITQQAIKRGVSEAVGYDIVEHSEWESKEGVFSHQLNVIDGKAFDFVMLYDVLDHAHDPEEVMSVIKRHLKPDGKVCVRCHPWTALHANHVYKKGLNRAFIHLFLHWDELNEIIGEDPMFTRPEKSPIEAYHWWFKDFKVDKERMITGPVSDFFHVPSFKELLANEQGIPMDQIDGFLKLMEVQFVDYSLSLP